MQFQWQRHPIAEQYLKSILENYEERNGAIVTLKEELRSKTSTRLFDWIDHIVIELVNGTEEELLSHGFEKESEKPSYRLYTHASAKLPSVLLSKSLAKFPLGIAIKVDRVSDFLMVRGLNRKIHGSPHHLFRKASLSSENGISLSVIERRGTREMEPFTEVGKNYLECYELWQTRLRDLDDEEEGMRQAICLAKECVKRVGKDVSAHLVLECEREYWQRKNRAAQVQKNRQDHLGMGWANHDHHTFRSSRHLFSDLVHLFEILGFECRERFYAGEKAGWGAQVMENKISGHVLFLDVDLFRDEVEIDFAHHPLPTREELHTVGLWCALHGDSILKSGMHHLEAQFDFDFLTKDLQLYGIDMMDPFSNFPFLKQAFTKGETWPVSKNRVEKLLQKGAITDEQATQFLTHGALGSHLENLQRQEGYKGFNKESVNVIIKKTDPRIVTD